MALGGRKAPQVLGPVAVRRLQRGCREELATYRGPGSGGGGTGAGRCVRLEPAGKEAKLADRSAGQRGSSGSVNRTASCGSRDLQNRLSVQPMLPCPRRTERSLPRRWALSRGPSSALPRLPAPVRCRRASDGARLTRRASTASGRSGSRLAWGPTRPPPLRNTSPLPVFVDSRPSGDPAKCLGACSCLAVALGPARPSVPPPGPWATAPAPTRTTPS